MTAQMTERQLKSNGIDMHFTEQSTGPLVVLCHGWPELSYSCRRRLPSIADAGFNAVAPDMRGYGRPSEPKDIFTYSIFHITGDIIGLVAALGERQAILIGHDWGAPIAWHCAMFRPDVFTAGGGLCGPPHARGAGRPLGVLSAAGARRVSSVGFPEA